MSEERDYELKKSVDYNNNENTDDEKTNQNTKSKSYPRSHYKAYSHNHGHNSSHYKKRNDTNNQSDLGKFITKVGKKNVKKAIGLILVIVAIALILWQIYLIETQKYIIKSSQTNQNNNISNNVDTEKTSDDIKTQQYTTSTTVSIPSYWNKMIEEKTKMVKALQTSGGKDCVSFAWASDTHIPDNSTARTNDLGKIMAKMMDNCDIPFAVLTGDIGTRASYDTEAELVKTQQMIPVHLAPLWGTDRLLVALGNHDGCYGDSSCYYAKQFSPERMWQLYFRNQALDTRRVFSNDGLYFYIDNVTQKTRFIVLNSHFAGEYYADDDSIAKYNRFATSCYGQEQLDWLANEALDMPDGYGAIITSHVPPNITYTVDKVQLIGIINAFCRRTTYRGSYNVGIEGWTNNEVDVDFTDAKGEIIAMFAGHVHQDTVDTTTLDCPLITIISAGAPVNDGESPERVFGTDTETSFDIVTINRRLRIIYLTRVGAGEDRQINY